MLTCAHVCSRMLTHCHVCSRMPTYAHVCSRMLTYADVLLAQRVPECMGVLLADIIQAVGTARSPYRQVRMLTYADAYGFLI